MEQKQDPFLKRRIEQSYTLEEVYGIAARCNFIKRVPPPTNPATGKPPTASFIKSWLVKIDLENILMLFNTLGQNTQKISTGKYLHPIEISKVLKLFMEDHLTDEHLDSGVVRVQGLMTHVNKSLLLKAQTLANYPAAGYRIASNEEACFEAKKSVVRSFGNISSALKKAFGAVRLAELPEIERERFLQIQQFCEYIHREYKNEIEEIKQYGNKNHSETKPEWVDPVDDVRSAPQL